MPTNVSASMSTIADALKLFYLDGLIYQANEAASVFLAQIEKTSRNVEGSQVVIPLSYGVTGGIGARGESDALPTSNPRKFKQMKVDTKNLFAVIQITDKVIQASRSNRGAFIQALESELTKAETDVKRDISRQVMGDGTGLLATVASVSSNGTTHTVTVDSAKHFYEGMLIDCYTTTTKDTSAAEVTSVDKVNNQIVFVSTTAPEAADLIYLAGNKNQELSGLTKIMTADNTLYDLDRSTHKWFNPTVKNVAGEISEVKIQEGIDDAEDETGSQINFLVGSKGVRRAYQNLLTAQKVIANSLELKGGFKALDYNGIPLVGDKYVPSGTLHALDLGDYFMGQMAEWDWMDRDGSILKLVQGYAVYTAQLRKYCELCAQRPKGSVRFYGITEH